MPTGDRTINWVIPDFAEGSGGHINIFRLVRNLELKGFECRVVIVGGCQCSSGAAARKLIQQHFSPIDAEVEIGEANLRLAAITVATSWPTAYVVRNFTGTLAKVYFVQDYEPFFYAHGSEFFFAEATYQMGLFGVTAGQWLADKLSREHGMETVSMGFSYDRGLYRPLPRREPERQRVFFYAVL